jgi:hypothetical protein
LLLDEDYAYLRGSGLAHLEDEQLRYLVLRDFPVAAGVYSYDGKPVTTVNVLVRIPSNYPTVGTDMLWVYPRIARTDAKAIPNSQNPGEGDASFFQGTEYCRWSRHYAEGSWKAGVDGIQKIISRIEWALRNPDANQSR